MTHATLHDGAHLPLHLTGDGPTVLLAVNPDPVEGPQAEAMRAWGADPALGRNLIAGLADRFRVVAFDYEGHLQRHPKPGTLTPDNVAADLLAVADAAGADRFAYYGYSWLALAGLQLALRTDRLSALVMGGYPPIDGPYRQMLAVTTAAHAMATAPAQPAGEVVAGDWSTVQVTSTEAQTRQFVTLYQALRAFDDRAADLGCPRLCVVGSADTIAYGPAWGGVVVDIAGPLLRDRACAEARGWDVAVLDGLDHMGAMQAAAVLPVLRPWLADRLPR
ncbi:alpha/beta fold hydrolase [Catellatospora sp. KI3]|uniref:alpha/beta fold hydrolase n=1 Tax=Catellatospora sp. KI3 TaxID=3041620 RepID=UPI002482B9B9|nr:alpha/beta fold hydrolase [Catellatospora sp. KI3]MDI1461630.1 alpha/beta fold hydrolase [Catellatospora sp. KI3]